MNFFRWVCEHVAPVAWPSLPKQPPNKQGLATHLPVACTVLLTRGVAGWILLLLWTVAQELVPGRRLGLAAVALNAWLLRAWKPDLSLLAFGVLVPLALLGGAAWLQQRKHQRKQGVAHRVQVFKVQGLDPIDFAAACLARMRGSTASWLEGFGVPRPRVHLAVHPGKGQKPPCRSTRELA